MAQRKTKCRGVNRSQDAHDGIVFFAMQAASNQKSAQHGNERDGDDGGAHHRERLCECQRMKEFSFHSGQCKHRHKCQDDDGHREEDRPADEPGGIQGDLGNFGAIFAAVLLGMLFRVANDVLRHHDSGIDQHANGDGDSAERHDVRRNAEVVHEEKRREDSQRQRNGDDQNAAEVPQEKSRARA